MSEQASAAPVTPVSLAELVSTAAGERELAPDFYAWLNSPLIGGGTAAGGRVTAVLERTAVLALDMGNGEERRMARLDHLIVDPADICWRPRPAPRRLVSEPSTARPAELAATRAASDERAHRSQGSVEVERNKVAVASIPARRSDVVPLDEPDQAAPPPPALDDHVGPEHQVEELVPGPPPHEGGGGRTSAA